MSIQRIHVEPHLQVWCIDLDATPAPQSVAALSDAEWDRARRFVFARDRQRFIAAHAALRETLAAQTGIPASLLEFRQGTHGKPALIDSAGLRFNLSHSQSVGLIAVCDDCEVGADIELPRPATDIAEVALHYFSEAECRALAALPAPAQQSAFLTCWTRKEACLKAAGMGLSVDTREVEVGIDSAARLIDIRSAEGPTRVAVFSLNPFNGASCAIARVLSPAEALAAATPRIQTRETCA